MLRKNRVGKTFVLISTTFTIEGTTPIIAVHRRRESVVYCNHTALISPRQTDTAPSEIVPVAFRYHTFLSQTLTGFDWHFLPLKNITEIEEAHYLQTK